jgi:FkbM family methyltransferase
MKSLVKQLLSLTPYRIVRRTQGNRFDAIECSLRSLRDRGYRPRLVIDGGAHVGSFSLAASQVFPDAIFHLIEPQPACAQALAHVARTHGFLIHACALSDQAGHVLMQAETGPTTGAHVATAPGPETVRVRAETIDGLLSSSIAEADRCLLKLDLQGYELRALKGALQSLARIEVILTEVSFFAQSYEPAVVELLAFLDGQGFILDDIAALAARRRDNRARQGDFIFVKRTSALAADKEWD